MIPGLQAIDKPRETQGCYVEPEGRVSGEGEQLHS